MKTRCLLTSVFIFLTVQDFFHLHNTALSVEARFIQVQKNHESIENLYQKNEYKRQIESMPEEDSPPNTGVVGDNSVFGYRISRSVKNNIQTFHPNTTSAVEQNTEYNLKQTNHPLNFTVHNFSLSDKAVGNGENSIPANFSNKKSMRDVQELLWKRDITPEIVQQPVQGFEETDNELLQNIKSFDKSFDPLSDVAAEHIANYNNLQTNKPMFMMTPMTGFNLPNEGGDYDKNVKSNFVLDGKNSQQNIQNLQGFGQQNFENPPKSEILQQPEQSLGETDNELLQSIKNLDKSFDPLSDVFAEHYAGYNNLQSNQPVFITTPMPGFNLPNEGGGYDKNVNSNIVFDDKSSLQNMQNLQGFGQQNFENPPKSEILQQPEQSIGETDNELLQSIKNIDKSFDPLSDVFAEHYAGYSNLQTSKPAYIMTTVPGFNLQNDERGYDENSNFAFDDKTSLQNIQNLQGFGHLNFENLPKEESKFGQSENEISVNMQNFDRPFELPVQNMDLNQMKPLYVTTQMSDLSLVNEEFGFNENLRSGMYNNALQNIQGFEDNGNMKPGSLQIPEEQTDKLQRILKYVQNELREDIFGPKEWNSSRIILKNIRFARNSKVDGNSFKPIYDNYGNKMSNEVYSPLTHEKNRDIMKRQLDNTELESIITTETPDESTQSVETTYNTESTTFADEDYADYEPEELSQTLASHDVVSPEGIAFDKSTILFTNTEMPVSSTAHVFSDFQEGSVKNVYDVNNESLLETTSHDLISQDESFVRTPTPLFFNTELPLTPTENKFTGHENKGMKTMHDITNKPLLEMTSHDFTSPVDHLLGTQTRPNDINNEPAQEMISDGLVSPDETFVDTLSPLSPFSKMTLSSNLHENTYDTNKAPQNFQKTSKLGKIRKSNSSNEVKMYFDIDYPDTDFNFDVVRKSIDDSEKFKGNRIVKRSSIRRRYFLPSTKHFEVFSRKRRQLRSVSLHSENSGINKNFALDRHSKNGLTKPENNSGENKTNFGKDNFIRGVKHGKYEVLKLNTLTPVKLVHKILGDASQNNETSNPHRMSDNTKTPRLQASSSKFMHKNTHSQSRNSESSYFANEKRENADDEKAKTEISDENENRTGREQDSENKRVVLKLADELSPEDSQKLLNLIYSNLSNPYNDSYIEFDGTNAIYTLNVSGLENGSFPKDIEIVKMLRKSDMWDNVHYIEERALDGKTKSRECCQNVLSIVKHNPLTVALILASCCIVIVVMLLGVFFMAERKFKHRYSPLPSSKKSSSNFKVVKIKKRITGGKIMKESNTPEMSAKMEAADSDESVERFDDQSEKLTRKARKKESKENEDEKRKLRSKKGKSKKSKDHKSPHRRGIFTRAHRWMRRRLSTVPLSDETEEDPASEARESEDSEMLSNRSSSGTDKSYTSKRQRLKRFVKTRGGRRKLSSRKPKVIAPDLRSTMKEVKLYLSEDEFSVTSLPALCNDLKERIVTTGDCQQIDNMLTRGNWEKTFFTAHGLDKISDEEGWMDHSPEERRKINIERLEEISAQSIGALGTLSKGSSSHSLKSAIGKSINTAEWVNKHPRPVPNSALKAKYGK